MAHFDKYKAESNKLPPTEDALKQLIDGGATCASSSLGPDNQSAASNFESPAKWLHGC